MHLDEGMSGVASQACGCSSEPEDIGDPDELFEDIPVAIE